MPEMTEETYTALLQKMDDDSKAKDAKIAELENKINDMTAMFKANMTVKGVSTNADTAQNEKARREYLEKKLERSVR